MDNEFGASSFSRHGEDRRTRVLVRASPGAWTPLLNQIRVDVIPRIVAAVISFVPVAAIATTPQIGGGFVHSIALKSDGTVWAWGYNSVGELGNNSTASSLVPVQVSGLTGVVSVAEGHYHSLALKSDGTVWAWGYNNVGELGNNSTTNSLVPVQVYDLTDVLSVAAGDYHSLALKSDGTVWAWGNNGNGELGNNSTINSPVPVQVSGLTGVLSVAAGALHSLALKSDGTVWAWGNNGNGELGNNSSISSLVPVQVSGMTGVVNVAAGVYHSLALKSDGTVWAWGYNGNGELGNNSTTSSLVPVKVSALTGVVGAVAGDYHSLAQKSDGTVWAWGNNAEGELGNNSTTNSLVPMQVSGLTGVVSMAAGVYQSLAQKFDGTVWAWGYNAYGQLGNNSTTSSLVPGEVVGPNGVGFLNLGTPPAALSIDAPALAPVPFGGLTTQIAPQTPTCARGDRKLVLVAHGWVPPYASLPYGEFPFWITTMRNSIRNYINTNLPADSCNWDVIYYDWWLRANTLLPQEAFANADEAAAQAYELIANKYTFVHLIAHSAGSEFVDTLAKKFKQEATPPLVHETLLDAYNPNGNLNSYGCRADWAESYVDMRPAVPASLLIQPIDFGDTNLTLTGALNIDVTQLGDSTWPPTSLGGIVNTLDASADHSWPITWYQGTIGAAIPSYGFPKSFEAQAGRNALPVTGANRGDRVCLAASGGTYSCSAVVTGPLPLPASLCGSGFVGLGQYVWDSVVNTVASATGIVNVIGYVISLSTNSPAPQPTHVNRPQSANSTTGAPAWLRLNLNVPKAANTLKFDAIFSSPQGAAGFLTVFVDGQLVNAREEAHLTGGVTTNISIPVGTLAAGTHWIGLRLDPTNSVPSQVQISNIRLGNTTLTSPSIVWRNVNGDVSLWSLSGGTISSSVDLGIIPSSWVIQGTGDFNGDGISDILWRNANGDVVTWFMNGSAIASSTDLGVIPASWTIQGTGDFNGDGTTDILWRNLDGDVVVWFMTAGSIASSADLGVISSDWTIQGTADFDGDGKTDILWRNANGDVVVWFMNGGTIAASADLGVVPSDWSIQCTGDFDGDGKSDILWRNVNGDVVVWFIKAGTIALSADLGVIPSSWAIQGTGDFNGDGKADILWRNSNGDVVTWLMNGGAISSSMDLGVIPAPWAINGVGH